MFAHVLVCADGSEPSLKAVQVAANLAKRCDALVTLLYVFDSRANAIPLDAAGDALLSPDALAYYRHEAQASVDLPAGRLFTEAGRAYQWRFEVGYPTEKILEVADQMQADLIVLGCRGLGGFQRLLLGSVSDGVLHHAHCSVMVVR